MILLTLPLLSLVMFLFHWNYKALLRLNLSALVFSGAYLITGGLIASQVVPWPSWLGHHAEWQFEGDFYVWDQHWSPLELAVATSAYLVMLASYIFSTRYFYLEKEARKFFALFPIILFGILTVTSGNSLDVVLIGWENVGLASIFLISFYAFRTRAIRNTVRIFIIYKLCDIGLLLDSLFAHHEKGLHTINGLPTWLSQNTWSSGNTIHFLALMAILAACGKSALFPFFNWPARAMEGPTPSSALFYGGPVLHLGVFLLIKLKDLILISDLARWVLLSLGLLTFFSARLVSHTQSTVKGHLAYKAVSHIGLISIWVALNWIKLAVLHIVMHMIYRSIRLIISPSVAYEQAHEGLKIQKKHPLLEGPLTWLPERWQSRIYNTLFALSLQEFFLSPSERGGIGVFDFTKIKRLLVTRSSFFLSFSGLLFIVLAFGFTNMNLPLTFGLLTMAAASLLCLKAIFSYDTVKSSHLQQLVSTTLFVLGTWLSLGHLSLGLLSFCCLIAIAFFLSFWALSPYFNYPLHTFHGAKYVGINRYRVMVVSFLIAAGYPLTPMFIAEDSLYSELLHVSITHTLLAFTYLLLLAIYWMRLMVKVFWGFHYKALIHPVFPPLYPSSKYK